MTQSEELIKFNKDDERKERMHYPENRAASIATYNIGQPFVTYTYWLKTLQKGLHKNASTKCFRLTFRKYSDSLAFLQIQCIQGFSGLPCIRPSENLRYE